MATHLSMLLQNHQDHTATTHHNLQRRAQAAEDRAADDFITAAGRLVKVGLGCAKYLPIDSHPQPVLS